MRKLVKSILLACALMLCMGGPRPGLQDDEAGVQQLQPAGDHV